MRVVRLDGALTLTLSLGEREMEPQSALNNEFRIRLTRMENSTGSFKVGDRVVVKRENPSGNPRTPKYIRGKKGTVADVHGVISNLGDHRGLYPPLYSVVFDVKDVFGGASPDKLRVDLHEDWLERAR